jgi:hypothetical protein
MSESQLQAAVTDLCGYRGIWWYHAHQPQHDNAGFPDLVLLGPNGALFRELKKATGKLSGAQLDVGLRMDAAGLDWALWKPADLHSGRIQRELGAIR